MIATPTAQNLANNSPPTSPQLRQGSASSSEQKPAPKKAPVSRLISTPKAKTDTGIKRTRKPASSKAKKPPQPSGYTWRKAGAGWDLRKSVYDETDTGIRKRRLPYVAHLSKSAFGELKRKHRGATLERAIAAWIAERDAL
jgi:hypothetical protein